MRKTLSAFHSCKDGERDRVEMLRYHALVALLVVVACVVAVAKADEDDDEPLVDVPEPVDEEQVLPRELGVFFTPKDIVPPSTITFVIWGRGKGSFCLHRRLPC